MAYCSVLECTVVDFRNLLCLVACSSQLEPGGANEIPFEAKYPMPCDRKGKSCVDVTSGGKNCGVLHQTCKVFQRESSMLVSGVSSCLLREARCGGYVATS